MLDVVRSLRRRPEPLPSEPVSSGLGAKEIKSVRRALAATLLLLLSPLWGASQTHSAFPVDITSAGVTQPFTAGEKTRLLYELHLTNYSVKTVHLLRLEVVGGEESTPLATYSGDALKRTLLMVGAAEPPPAAAHEQDARDVDGGRTVVVFLDLTLNAGVQPPKLLHHRLTMSTLSKDGSLIERTFDGPAVAVLDEPVPVLHAPLHGSGWGAFNGLTAPDHRRTVVGVDGRVRIAQRFAIDWARLGPDGLLSHGDPHINASYYGYGAEVLAVADARVSDLKDGLPQNAGSNEQRVLPVTLDTIAGNYLILDLGQGHFALYAHLQPGSLRVKLGDTVKAGQVLALLGNSGNSDAPHLHFQLMDANSALAAEGLPYELESFTELGVIDDPDSIDAGKAWHAKPGLPPLVRRSEFPLDNAVLSLP